MASAAPAPTVSGRERRSCGAHDLSTGSVWKELVETLCFLSRIQAECWGLVVGGVCCHLSHHAVNSWQFLYLQHFSVILEAI